MQKELTICLIHTNKVLYLEKLGKMMIQPCLSQKDLFFKIFRVVILEILPWVRLFFVWWNFFRYRNYECRCTESWYVTQNLRVLVKVFVLWSFERTYSELILTHWYLWVVIVNLRLDSDLSWAGLLQVVSNQLQIEICEI